MLDVFKVAVILMAYFGVGPLLGYKIAKSRKAQRLVFCLMMIMPCLQPGKLTLMVDSWSLYRGHTKGFEANWIEVLGIAIIVASRLNAPSPRRWKLLTPGTLCYLLWVTLSMISFFTAEDKVLALMAAFKFAKVVIVFVAAAHFLRDEEDLKWIARTIAGVQVFYLLLCLKLRYVDGMFQIKGWFEHQNPMAMWCYMSAVPLLGLAMNTRTGMRDFFLYMAGYGSAVICVILSVSRGGLGGLALGSVAIMGLACLREPNVRVLMVTVGCILGGAFVAANALHSLHARITEVNQSAEDNDKDLRAVLNIQSAAMLSDSIIGVGWNNYGVMNSRPVGDKYSEILEDWDADRGFRIYDDNYQANPLTESLYWLMLAETGLPGFLGFVIFAVVSLWLALRAWWRDRNSLAGSFAVSVLIVLSICYVHGSVERILTQTKNLSFWMMLCGLISALYAMPRIQRNQTLAPAWNH